MSTSPHAPKSNPPAPPPSTGGTALPPDWRPFRLERRRATAASRAAAARDHDAHGGPSYQPAGRSFGAIDRALADQHSGTPQLGQLLTWATHPDERVPITLLAHPAFEEIVRYTLSSDDAEALAACLYQVAFGRANAERTLWTPLLDTLDAVGAVIDDGLWNGPFVDPRSGTTLEARREQLTRGIAKQPCLCATMPLLRSRSYPLREFVVTGAPLVAVPHPPGATAAPGPPCYGAGVNASAVACDVTPFIECVLASSLRRDPWTPTDAAPLVVHLASRRDLPPAAAERLGRWAVSGGGWFYGLPDGALPATIVEDWAQGNAATYDDLPYGATVLTALEEAGHVIPPDVIQALVVESWRPEVTTRSLADRPQAMCGGFSRAAAQETLLRLGQNIGPSQLLASYCYLAPRHLEGETRSRYVRHAAAMPMLWQCVVRDVKRRYAAIVHRHESAMWDDPYDRATVRWRQPTVADAYRLNVDDWRALATTHGSRCDPVVRRALWRYAVKELDPVVLAALATDACAPDAGEPDVDVTSAAAPRACVSDARRAFRALAACSPEAAAVVLQRGRGAAGLLEEAEEYSSCLNGCGPDANALPLTQSIAALLTTPSVTAAGCAPLLTRLRRTDLEALFSSTEARVRECALDALALIGVGRRRIRRSPAAGADPVLVPPRAG